MAEYTSNGKIPEMCPNCGGELKMNPDNLTTDGQVIYKMQCENCGYEIIDGTESEEKQIREWENF